ncbi:hypothetical protein U1Q18_050547 [Sarracenia purpurea var. burkii]
MTPIRLVSIFSLLQILDLLISFVGCGHSNSKSNDVIGGLAAIGWTIPRENIILEVGQPLEIYCSLDLDNPMTKGYTAKDIVFKKDAEKVDSKYVTAMNKSTARLYIDNLPISIKKEYFNCTLGLHEDSDENPSKSHDSPRSKSREWLISSNKVTIGVKPQEVGNFTCHNYNWESLNCTWDEPNNGIETNYTIYYWLPRKTRKTHPLYRCPIWEREKCIWTTATVPTYRRFFKYLYFRMDGVNKFGNISHNFTFDNFGHVIPYPPTEITHLSKTPHSIYLQWSIGMWIIFEMDLDYIVKYARISTQDWKIKRYHGKDTEKHRDIARINITDLEYPNTAYDFKIYMKSPLADEECWSQPASAVINTSPCAPYVSPETDVGSFEVYREDLHRRDVLVYWKQIPELEHNGDDFHYKIVVWENNSRVNVRPVFICNSYANFTNLTFNSYRFYIKSVNEIGSAPHSSVVHLPKKQDILPKPVSFTKIITSNGAYHLTWQLPNADDSRITNVTIFWCETNRAYSYTSLCPGVFNWTHLNAGTFEYEFPANPYINYELQLV